MDGDALWLSANDLKFLSIFIPADDDSKENALITVLGTEVHPDWVQLVRAIRVEMSTRGRESQFSVKGGRRRKPLL